MVDFSTPARDGRLNGFGQFCGERLQLGPAGLGGSDQVAIKLALFVLSATVFDGPRPLLGQAPTVAPATRPAPPVVPRRDPGAGL